VASPTLAAATHRRGAHLAPTVGQAASNRWISARNGPTRISAAAPGAAGLPG